ncbi:N-acetyltransferase [Gillisia sp. M10.2A]|uniref:N-acetyltransferase n=1 Tax=Gillisia lutea TaxID=2909668 RepID=A0ABS9EFR5_9FLAO|nr:GNAT family N-acetyltransferase [Gillisia lutea]MCF4101727.1 N-acetyltransferase [Gillisia lutea]
MKSEILFTIAEENDLSGILRLQHANSPANLSTEEMIKQGFITVIHSLEQLMLMNEIAPHIIGKSSNKVVAYLLAMTAASKNDIPILKPMFNIFDNLQYNSHPVSSYNYLVVGQVCVDKNYRGKGILDNCYNLYRKTYKNRFDFAITEIDARNLRSINAHKRIGFKELSTYRSGDGTNWIVIIWDWEQS